VRGEDGVGEAVVRDGEHAQVRAPAGGGKQGGETLHAVRSGTEHHFSGRLRGWLHLRQEELVDLLQPFENFTGAWIGNRIASQAERALAKDVSLVVGKFRPGDDL
jgi:hypothetical protein